MGEQNSWPTSISEETRWPSRDGRLCDFRALAENYLTREAAKLRTANRRRAILERAVFPALGDKAVEAIKRSDVVRLLDKIEDTPHPLRPMRRFRSFAASSRGTTRASMTIDRQKGKGMNRQPSLGSRPCSERR